MADFRKLWHFTVEKGWHEVRLHAVDAVHALAVDSENWKAEKPSDEAEVADGETADESNEAGKENE